MLGHSNQDVQAKAKAAVAWCAAVSKTTKKSWEYKLILHDAIQPELSFRGVVSTAISVEPTTPHPSIR